MGPRLCQAQWAAPYCDLKSRAQDKGPEREPRFGTRPPNLRDHEDSEENPVVEATVRAWVDGGNAVLPWVSQGKEIAKQVPGVRPQGQPWDRLRTTSVAAWTGTRVRQKQPGDTRLGDCVRTLAGT